MWDYDTREEFYKKYSTKQCYKHNYKQNHFNVIASAYKNGIASADEIFQLYHPHVWIDLFELSWPLIRDNRLLYFEPKMYEPFELMYLEVKRKSPNYAPGWQKEMRVTRAVHP